MVDMSEKVCNTCGFKGPESSFRPKSNQCLNCRKKYLREYELKNKEKRTAQKLAWAAANSEKSKEISKKTKLRSRERMFAERNRQKALKMNAKGSHTVKEWVALCILSRWRCLSCGKAKPLTRDHIVPLEKGGSDWISNIQPLCKLCNSKKGLDSTDFRFALVKPL